MSNPSQTGEIEKFGVIPARLDDLKKTYKTLKFSLNESLGAFNNYGKSLIKASRNLHFAFNHSDPSFICKLTLNLLTQQAQTSNLLNTSVSEALKDFSKDMDTYEEKLEQTRSKTFDKISESLKSLGAARAGYVKERGNYEKVCKETEAAVAERKKPITDPLLYYNMTHQRKLKAKVVEGLQNLTTSEQQVRDALDTYSIRQQVLNVGLSESLRVFKETLKTVLESIFSNVKKHNQIVQDFLQKELSHYENSDMLTSVGTFSFPSDSEEQEYIQKVAAEVQDPQAKDPSQTKEPKEQKSKYLDIHYKLLEKPDKLSDQEIYEYAELAQRHYEAALSAFEGRQKVIKGLKAYMLDLAVLCANTDKIFQKIAKGSLSQVSASTLSKRLGSNIDALFEGFTAFGSVFQQVAGYLNSKAPLLDGLTNDYRDYIKVFQAGSTKALRDSIGVRSTVTALVGQQDKFTKRINELNEKDPDDERLPSMIEELDSVKRQLGEQVPELRRQTIETAAGINKAFDDYRIQEQMKFMDFQNIIKEHLKQENKLAKGLMDALKVIEAGLEAKSEVPVVDKAEEALKEDNLNGHLQYYETNMQDSQNGTKKTLEFKKLYVPPGDLLNEEEVIEKVDVGEEDDDVAPGKEQEKVMDEGDKISAEKLRKRFGLKANEKLVENFACGVEQRIIRQGRMYIYNSAVCFSTVKLLGDIAISIPFDDVLKIEKKTMSLVFDTALSVITKNGEIKFLSFFYRDKAFNLLANLLKENSSTFATPEKEKTERKDSSNVTPKLENEPGSGGEQNKKRMQEIVTERLNRAATAATEAKEKEKEEEKGSGMRRASLDLSEDEGEKQDNGEDGEVNEENKEKESGEKEQENKKVKEDGDKVVEKVEVENDTKTSVATTAATGAGDQKENVKAEQVTEAKKPVESEAEKKIEKKEPEGPSQEELDKKEKQQLKKVITEKKGQLIPMIVSEDTCPQVMAQETFACSALDLFMSAFSDRKVTYKGKSFECFWVLVKTEGKDVDIKYKKWDSEPPFEGVYEDKDSLECLRKLAQGPGKTTRSIVYTHPVNGGPFVPKQCQVDEKHTGYWLSPTEFIMQMEVQTSKIPMSDCFFARNYFKIKELPGPKCEFTWKLGIEFVKSTMFKGKITSATQEENLSYAQKIFVPLLKENMAVWMKEKAQVLKKREAKKEAKREAEREFDRQAKEQRLAAAAKSEEAKRLAEEKAAVSENKEDSSALKKEGEEKVSLETKEEEKKVEEDTEIRSGGSDEAESEKEEDDLVKKELKNTSGLKEIIKESIRESLGDELGKFIKEAERSREEARSEVKMLRNLVFALLAINCFVILYLLRKS